jgi:peptidoglycan/LPS O-acetylase OafA/YrhL
VSLLLLWQAVRLFPQLSVNGVRTINWIPEFLYISNYTRERPILAPWSWSLSMEEHFYLFGPFLVFGICMLRGHASRIGTLFLLAGTAVLLRFYKFHQTADATLNIFRDLFIPTHLRFDTFIWGILAAYFSFYFPEKMKLFYQRKAIRWSVWAAILGLIAIFLHPIINRYPFMYLSYGGAAPDEVVREVGFRSVLYFGLLSGILFLLLIQALIYTDGAVSRLLGHPFFRVMATLSYAFYLVHLPIAKWVTSEGVRIFPDFRESLGTFWLTSFVVTCLLSYGLSYILHLLIEKPCLYVRDRYFP